MKAVLITRKTLAAEAASRWMETYGRNGGGYGRDKVDILHQLEALGSTPKPADVDNIIGNKSWTQVPSCDGCGKLTRKVVRVGEHPDYESSTAHLCLSCVRSALRLMESDQP